MPITLVRLNRETEVMICDTIQDSLCQIRQVCTDTITIGRHITDSVTIEALKNSQTFYNNAFDSLLFNVSIVLCVIGILVAIVGIFLGIVRSNKEKEFEKNNEKILQLEKKFEEQLEEQKNLFDKELKSIRNDIFEEIAESHFTFAMQYFKSGEMLSHFVQLGLHYSALKEVDISRYELDDILILNAFVEKYTEEDLEFAKFFLYPFQKFMQDCKETNKQEFIEEAEKKWQELCEKFGGEEIVLETIEAYGKSLEQI